MKTAQGNFYRTRPDRVHETLSRFMLADGFHVVFDFDKSHGAWLHDAKSGEDYLDLFAFFASQPVGYGHEKLNSPEFLSKLAEVSTCKPTNSDVYTQAMADFVETFGTDAIPETHRSHLFFVEGGALAVENAMKAAFDWKYRKNQAKGAPLTENLEILHFEDAFHGRSGYTLSVTNTHDPRKYQYFPKFDWPRVPMAPCTFPMDAENTAKTEALERKSLDAVREAFATRKDRIAAILIETIQGEGGDNHFRREYLQGLRDICDEHDALLIFDEVQAGLGLTGNWWAWQGVGVEPDIFAFGKKTQVCGIAANKRLDEVESVFQVSSRINSTWGGGLADMVRCERYVQIIRDEKLLQHARDVGGEVVESLTKLGHDTGKISNVRGRGLMIAFDLPTEAERDRVQHRLMDHRAMMLGSGDRSLRFRPVLDLGRDAAQEACARIARSLED